MWYRLTILYVPVSLVAAEPIRVIEHPSNANIRFGHALANANVNGNDDNVARVVRPVVLMNPAPLEKVTGFSRHFCGASLREKALHFSNAIRHALGMPLIEVHRVAPRPGELHILPMPYPLQSNVILHPQDESDKPRKYYGHERPNHPGGDGDHEHTPHDGHHGHHGHHHRHHKSFLKRIHKAIKALGPWEGRAVSFVLGKKSGVLPFSGLIHYLTRLRYRRSFEDVLGSVRSYLSHRAG